MGKSRPVLWLEQEDLKGQRMAGSRTGDVIIIRIWCWLYSSDRPGHLLPPHPSLSPACLSKSHNKNDLE